MSKPITIIHLFVFIFSICVSKSYAETNDFSHWPDQLSPQEIGRKAAANFIKSPHMLYPTNNTIHYAEVATWYGAISFAKSAQDKELLTQLTQRFDPFWSTERNLVPPANHVDFSVFGVIPLQLYSLNGDVRLRNLGLGFADAQWDRPIGSGPHEAHTKEFGLSNQTRYWIDDMYMITALQGSAYSATHNPQYLDRAAREMVVYLNRLQEKNGLFYHAPDAPVFWGRGNGWMAAGMTELLLRLPKQHPQRTTIFKSYQKMMASLLNHQSSTGLWRQLIDHPEFWDETSGSAMFAFAFAVGVKEGWLPEKTYGPALHKAWIALAQQVNANGELQEVCVGTGAKNDVTYYMDRPRTTGDFHGQAALLWVAAALIDGK